MKSQFSIFGLERISRTNTDAKLSGQPYGFRKYPRSYDTREEALLNLASYIYPITCPALESLLKSGYIFFCKFFNFVEFKFRRRHLKRRGRDFHNVKQDNILL